MQSLTLNRMVRTGLTSPGDPDEPDDETRAAIRKAFEPMRLNIAKIVESMQPSLGVLSSISESVSTQMAAAITAPMQDQWRKLTADIVASLPTITASSLGIKPVGLPAGFADAIGIAHQYTLRKVMDSVQFSAADWVGLQAFLDDAQGRFAGADLSDVDGADQGALTWQLPDGISVEWLQRFGLFLLVIAYSLPMLLPAANAHHFRELQGQLFNVGAVISVMAVWVSKAK